MKVCCLVWASLLSSASVLWAQSTEDAWLRFVGREQVPPGPRFLAPGFSYPPMDSLQMQRVIDRCLMVRNLGVVNDARAKGEGAWSFAGLVRKIANQPATNIEPTRFVEAWLESLDGQMAKRTLAIWDQHSGGARKLEHLPFRLLAIVNRVDLRNNLVLSEPPPEGGAGELRFVYGLYDENYQAVDRVTVILEFRVRASSFDNARLWGSAWYALRFLSPESEAYKRSLQALTDQVVRAGANPAQRPNHSALAQVRVSDGISSKSWLFKEFRLGAAPAGYLVSDTTKQTPGIPWNESEVLDQFLTQYKPQILGQNYQVPPTFNGEEFLSTVSTIPFTDLFWRGKEPPTGIEEARHLFSLNTCNSCHSRETATNFFHVFNRQADKVAELSDFLTGVTVPDPMGQPDPIYPGLVLRRRFADLPRRAVDLRALVVNGEQFEQRRLPMNAVH
jgi:hypothetical protein